MSAAFMIVVFLMYIANLMTSVPATDWVWTPHGRRPAECVISHDESNVIIETVAGGVLVRYPDRLSDNSDNSDPISIFYKSTQKCMDNAKDIMRSESHHHIDVEKSMDNGGWDIFGMFYCLFFPLDIMFVFYNALSQAHYSQNNLTRFDASYVVPKETLPLTQQLLYYFVGLESGSIIQPVVAWCGNAAGSPLGLGCGYSYKYSGWQMAAWYCCPAGLSHFGKSIKLDGGEVIVTSTRSDLSTGSVRVTMNTTAGQSSLEEVGAGTQFDRASIAGEFYRYSECNQFNSEPFIFKEMEIWDTNNHKVDITASAWMVYNLNPLNCSGEIVMDYPEQVTIKGRL